MSKFNIKPTLLLLAGSSVLTGCTGLMEAREINKEAEKQSKAGIEKGSQLATSSASTTQNTNSASTFGRATKNWVDPVPLPRAESKAELPALFNKNISMTMPGTINAVEILSEMQRSTGVKFKLSNDIYDNNTNVGQILGSTSTPSSGNAVKPLLIPDFVFKGSLENALDLLASKANVSWKWTGTEVEVYRFETKTYNISSLAGQTNTMSNVTLNGNQGDSSGGSSGGGGASASAGASTGAQQKAAVQRSSKLTTWDEIKPFILAQMSSTGKVAILESAGAVTIKDTPQAHKRIQKAIDDINGILTRQVYLNVDIFAIKAENGDNFVFSPDALFTSLTGFFGISGPTASKTLANASTISAGVLSGPWAGTTAFLQALSTMGNASLINQFTITTLSGQPAPISSSISRGYVKTQEVTVSGNPTTTQVSIETDSAIEGVNMSVTPKVENNGNILLEYSLNINEILCLDIVGVCAQEFKPEGSTIPNKIGLPVTQGKSFLQRAQLRSGQTLLVSGFKQRVGNQQNSGVGSPYNPLFGSTQIAGATIQYLVVTITPYIANNNEQFRKN